ncbi:protein-disulfide isomerase [Erythrobacter litoralis]|uniref:DsbA family protein n=1 Tax=Erythrobacter litoralis TaxID=39960 RepID=UPI002435EE00|nr:thioredoxin domain-containing protein [Erythrobacter litoralis]MDG6078567.1 protein-disulfide isomerase [Erythrobacter litoralis]
MAKRSFWLSGAAALACALAIGASAQDLPTGNAGPTKGNWNATIVENAGGHRMGNPKAAAKLVEFMSYTCSHCATFARTGDGALKMLYVPSGKISYEIRHLVRDPVDLTATLATQCGEPSKFFRNHEAIMARQTEWMAKAQNATQAQQARWKFGSFGSRAQAIASDLDFYDIMEGRGYTRAQLDKCLTDEAKARRIAEQSGQDTETFKLVGTPSFVLNGETLEGVHNWPTLQPLLDSYY